MKLSIVIPCYNEAESLPALVRRIAMAAVGHTQVEYVLVDNGSSDECSSLIPLAAAENENIAAVRVEENQGYGFGILSGLRAARGEFMGWTHADLQTDPLDVLRAVKIIETHEAPQTLYLKGARYARPLADRCFTVAMSLLESLLFQHFLWDINAQPNIFHRSFFERWENPPHDFSLDLYAYAAARRHRLNIIRFPVLFEAREYGTSHWNVNWQAKAKFIQRTLGFSLSLRKKWRG